MSPEPLVVSDTSPLRALAHLGRVGLLRDLYAEVLVPPAVVGELAAPKRGMPLVEVADYDFLVVRAPKGGATLRRLLDDLDAGEAEALALAREVGATTVLMDERDGREEAKRMGLRPVGVIGILVQAKARSLIEEVGPALIRLRVELRFRFSDDLYRHALKLAGET